ncbi:DUF397 domain-containing protein [Nocardiopsis mangrovi]|uniref:DUF397 domain-containing protein n=1 Tax=Nocardiopsis mangrovi TaxID=1179818 RepID=A0ABV9E771_9ACTN
MREWHKSSHSDSNYNCVEVAEGPRTLIRDTQNRPLGHLTVPVPEWTAFLKAVKAEAL